MINPEEEMDFMLESLGQLDDKLQIWIKHVATNAVITNEHAQAVMYIAIAREAYASIDRLATKQQIIKIIKDYQQ